MMFNEDVIDRKPTTPLVVGILISLLNILLVAGFLGACALSAFANRELGLRIPVIPLVVFAFALLAPAAWLLAGRWVLLEGKPRLIAAALGQVPLVCGVGLTFLLGLVNMVFGGPAAGVVMPILAAGIGFVAGTISVLCIFFAHPNLPKAEVPEPVE